jgi:Sec-independent protein secretion pathway component TatC
MLVTGSPLIVLGMVTAPPEPVYPVMVIVPLLVV